MPVEIQEEAEGKTFALRLSGKLTKQDYEHFVPETERRITPPIYAISAGR